jgi:hypothetical protein
MAADIVVFEYELTVLCTTERHASSDSIGSFSHIAAFDADMDWIDGLDRTVTCGIHGNHTVWFV